MVPIWIAMLAKLAKPAAAKPLVITVNIAGVRRVRRYGEIISGASLWPRKITVLPYIDSTLLMPSTLAIAPPITNVAYWMTRR